MNFYSSFLAFSVFYIYFFLLFLIYLPFSAVLYFIKTFRQIYAAVLTKEK